MEGNSGGQGPENPNVVQPGEIKPLTGRTGTPIEATWLQQEPSPKEPPLNVNVDTGFDRWKTLHREGATNFGDQGKISTERPSQQTRERQTVPLQRRDSTNLSKQK